LKETVIQVDHLSKQYRLGELHMQTNSFRDRITRTFKRSFPKKDGSEPSLKSRESIWAVKDVSFDVQEGEILGIIGRNGAGKSTLLKILSRITKPTTGTAWIKGRVGSLLEVGTGFHGELTGRENVFLNGAILGMKRSEISRKFDQIVGFSEIGQFIDTPVKRYSSGMYVRLAFAVAAHLEPEILLVDEVLAVGDASFKKKCTDKMADISELGKAIVFVSHNMGAVLNLCSRVLVMNEGVVIYDGEPTESIDKYMESTISEIAPLKEVDPADRSGTGEVRLRDFYIEDENGKRTTSLIGGKKYSFFFRIRAHEKIRWDRVHMGFAFGTMQEIMLVYCDNAYTDEIAPNIDRDEMLFRCDIPRFPLVAGQYVLRGRLFYGKELSDFLDHFATVQVEKGMFYPTGEQAWKNPVMIEYSWEFETDG
jgi:lipopolysaccharide transport system ATP-binding protein